MKHLKLLAVSALVLSAMAAFGPASADTSSQPCLACAAPVEQAAAKPVQMALMQRRTETTAAAEALAGPRTDIQVPRDIRTCCDPNLANIVPNTMFSFSTNPAGSIASNYGLTFNPSPAYMTALDNTAGAVLVTTPIPMSLWNTSWLVVEGEMHTDNVPNNTWPVPLDTSWAGFTTVVGGQTIMAWQHAPLTSSVSGVLQQYQFPTVNPMGHLRPDGTRYILRLSTWMWTYVREQGWVKRRIICNNAGDKFVGVRINQAGMRMAPGSSAGSASDLVGLASAVDATPANARMSMSAPVAPTAAEIAALPPEMQRAGQ